MTTDFDVLEDMLVKDWAVEYSFSIRYKHLLKSGQGQQETDKDIDHILGVGSGGEEDEDEGRSSEEEGTDDERERLHFLRGLHLEDRMEELAGLADADGDEAASAFGAAFASSR